MIETSEGFRAAVTGAARRVRVRLPMRVVSPDLQYEGAEAADQADMSRLPEVYDGVTEAKDGYASLELNRWTLDGTADFWDDSWDGETGFVSGSLSGEDGSFEPPVQVTLTISGVRVLQACGVFFPGGDDGTAEAFTVEIGQGGTIYYRTEITGNREPERLIRGFTVYNPDTIRVTVTKWSLPLCRARITELYPGFSVTWTEKDILDLQLRAQASVNGMTAPYGTGSVTLDNTDRMFDPRDKNSLFLSLEERQPIPAEIGVDLENGTEYVPWGKWYRKNNGWTSAEENMAIKWEVADILGLLADREFVADGALPETLEGWAAALAAQLGNSFRDQYQVDTAYGGLSMTAEAAEIQGQNCGDILRWLCQASGTFARADQKTGKLTIEPTWDQGTSFTLDNLESYPEVSANDNLSVILFQMGQEQLVVSGNTASSANTVSVSNPFLHTTESVLAAGRHILTAYGGNKLKLTGRGDPSAEVGDAATVELDGSTAVTARLVSQSLDYSGGVLSGCRLELLQADGIFLYTERAVITESGEWTAPEGAAELEIILVGGGQAGGHGEAGTYKESLLDYRAGDNWGSYGAAGTAGAGGKVWHGKISINPGQVFTVHIGAGGTAGEGGPTDGEETTFGAWSSGNGRVYDPAFTDLSSGSAFGRAGVKAPKANTGDGGAGGAGGTPGYEWCYYKTDEFGNVKYGALYTKSEYTRPPGEGSPGTDGGSGCVIVYWEKGESA